MLKSSLQLKLSQQQKMSPQMQQNIGLLLLPIVDIQELIQSSLDENIMLETDEVRSNQSADGTHSSMASEDSVEWNAENPINLDQTNIVSDAEWHDRQIANESDFPKNLGYSKNTDDISDSSGQTLINHLLWQLELEKLNPQEMIIGRVIIDAIDEETMELDITLERYPATYIGGGSPLVKFFKRHIGFFSKKISPELSVSGTLRFGRIPSNSDREEYNLLVDPVFQSRKGVLSIPKWSVSKNPASPSNIVELRKFNFVELHGE